MPLSISQAAPNVMQTTTGTSGSKGIDANNFMSTLNQTISGDSTIAGQANDQMAGILSTIATSIPSMLASQLSEANVTTIIEQLVNQLDEVNVQNSEHHLSEDELNDALVQLDSLLASLFNIPSVPKQEHGEEKVDKNIEDSTDSIKEIDLVGMPNVSQMEQSVKVVPADLELAQNVEALPKSSSSKIDLVSMPKASQMEQSVKVVSADLGLDQNQNAEALPKSLSSKIDLVSVPRISQIEQPVEIAPVIASVIAGLEQDHVTDVDSLNTVPQVKAYLQDALTDLKSFIQQGGSSQDNVYQLTAITKQISYIQQLVNGAEPKTLATDNEPAAEVIEGIKTLQSASTTNALFQRMGSQLLPVGVLSVISPQKEDFLLGEQDEQMSSDENLQVIQSHSEIQRQVQFSVKPAQPQTVPVQQFAETVEALVVKQFTLTKANGVSEARISLYPEHLGQVDVRISVTNGILTAQIHTDTVAARDLLENQLTQLRSALQSQGLQVEKLEVAQTTQQSSLFQEHHGQGGREQQASKRNKSHDHAVGDISFKSDLEEVQVEQVVDRDMGLGRGIHTRA